MPTRAPSSAPKDANNRRLRAAAGLLLAACAAPAAMAGEPAASADLASEIAAQDAAVFDTFNRCADPAQLALHASHFDPAVEFYHDTGGVTWTRDAMIANTRQYACGHYTRELVPGTFEAWPVKDFGAISRGQHRFCQAGSGKCEGIAEFTMVWRLQDGQWRVTRVLSYGHRAAPD